MTKDEVMQSSVFVHLEAPFSSHYELFILHLRVINGLHGTSFGETCFK
jgi:hypothetical protein